MWKTIDTIYKGNKTMIFKEAYEKTIFVKKNNNLLPIGITDNKEYHLYRPWEEVKIFFNLKKAVQFSLDLKG
jgi:hypothetical protein